jgi:hypothetical protein
VLNDALNYIKLRSENARKELSVYKYIIKYVIIDERSQIMENNCEGMENKHNASF